MFCIDCPKVLALVDANCNAAIGAPVESVDDAKYVSNANRNEDTSPNKVFKFSPKTRD